MFSENSNGLRLIDVLQAVIGISAAYPHICQKASYGICIRAPFFALTFPICEYLVIAMVGTNIGGGGDATFPMIIAIEIKVCESYRCKVLPEM